MVSSITLSLYMTFFARLVNSNKLTHLKQWVCIPALPKRVFQIEQRNFTIRNFRNFTDV